MALTPKNSNANDPDARKLSAEDEIAIREIDEAVRQDDAAEFVRRYGLVIGSVLAVVLVGLGGYLFWDSQVEAALEAESEQVVSVIDYAQAEDFPSVKERTRPLLDSDTPGVRTSARLLHAAAALELGETARAVELYAQIAADEKAPQAMRDLARLREVATNFDDREPSDIIARLEPLAKPGGALFGSAAELSAMAHLEAGNREEAGALFAAIAKDDTLPATLRDRARQMTGQLGVDAVEDVEEVLEEQGIAPQEPAAGSAAGVPPAQ
ncbi:MAG: tetratricopeptide repeat protein [Erythrobacter sp.]|uniref:tetratricopeptide repeat protein n=1 Tax=Erythrobacter sp. TaxID=1042 RepID=UPI0026314D91|nr:tetratricopeptide repeat protein [Erythrobacter sp.]MDJ0977087.1 tetratricopeptide repeat protein [Erythrobacter sp.]